MGKAKTRATEASQSGKWHVTPAVRNGALEDVTQSPKEAAFED